LNRWGFRLRVRPIYGSSSFVLKEASLTSLMGDIQSKFGGEKSFNDFVSSLGMLSLVVIEVIELHINGNVLSEKEKSLSKFLRWNLLKGGVFGAQISQFLNNNNGLYQLVQKPSYHYYESSDFEGKFDQMKEEIYSRIAKC
jgi:hypothetical protein